MKCGFIRIYDVMANFNDVECIHSSWRPLRHVDSYLPILLSVQVTLVKRWRPNITLYFRFAKQEKIGVQLCLLTNITNQNKQRDGKQAYFSLEVTSAFVIFDDHIVEFLIEVSTKFSQHYFHIKTIQYELIFFCPWSETGFFPVNLRTNFFLQNIQQSPSSKKKWTFPKGKQTQITQRIEITWSVLQIKWYSSTQGLNIMDIFGGWSRGYATVYTFHTNNNRNIFISRYQHVYRTQEYITMQVYCVG